MMLTLAPIVLAAAVMSPAPQVVEPNALYAPVMVASVDDLRFVPLTAVVLAASEIDLSQRMNDLGLVGSTGLFGGAPQLESANYGPSGCPR